MERIETVIVGGGQAGLATSYYLAQHGREHIVLEQAAHAGNVWRNERWDSFTLVTPNWALKMPGAEYNGADPEGFMQRDEIIAYFEQYVERFQLPVQYNTAVKQITWSWQPASFSGRRYRRLPPACHPASPSSTAARIVIPNRFRQAQYSSSAARSQAARLPRNSTNMAGKFSCVPAVQAGYPVAIAAGM
jgi:glycine/D-amino acid oxidase-like deaminating enzyme